MLCRWSLPSLIRSGVFCFFMAFRGAEHMVFCCVFCPCSKVGNSQLHSTRFCYLSFYGIYPDTRLLTQALEMIRCRGTLSNMQTAQFQYGMRYDSSMLLQATFSARKRLIFHDSCASLIAGLPGVKTCHHLTSSFATSYTPGFAV